jgi:hypothetical protein
MASVGKFVAALNSVSNEVTLAVAQFNMDFTLMKVEAPLEYQGLGSALSTNRREQAEAGSPHTTARKLGALFEEIIPDTPKLYAAYGERSSDIAKFHSTNGTITQLGPFSAHEGLDGTSLWAAATSGKRAIAIHLLACMLSKIWKGPEAISVWVELVSRRKTDILENLEGGSMQTTANLMAARQEVTRANLAAWDASARAWLQTGDEANKIRQTQLRLVLDNISLPVNNQSDLYQSVLKAWTNALLMVESLVSGMPQSVHDGAVLLALSAWHLYPDMLVLGPTTARIEQNDPLVRSGGILTIGLHHNGDTGAGVFWSLPLAHMRYYGEAPIVSRSLATDSSRISFEQLYQVTLGCLSTQWRMPLLEVTKVVIALHSTLSTQWKASSNLGKNAKIKSCHASETDNRQPVCLADGHWFSTLYEAANISQRAWGQSKDHFTRLSNFGARRGESFLDGESEGSDPVFGLCNPKTLIILSDGLEARIELLRGFSKNFPVDPNDIFIRYPTVAKSIYGWAYASALTYRFETTKRSLDGTRLTVESHIRWTYRPEDYSELPEEVWDNKDRPVQIRSDSLGQYERHIEKLRLTKEKCYFIDRSSIRESEEFTLEWREYGKERYIFDESGLFGSNLDQELIYPGAYEGYEDDVDEFEFLMGDPEHEALFIRKGTALDRYTGYGHGIYANTNELLTALNDKLIVPALLDNYLHSWGTGTSNISSRNLGTSLRSLSIAKTIYDDLHYATVNLAVVGQPLHQAKWIRSENSQPELPERFSCIAMFESGTFNIAPEHLHRVMALAVGNSIYVADFLQCEPPVHTLGHTRGITRITGSIGRSEMAMLVSPATPPPLRALDFKNWNIINHNTFDGNCQNCFQNSTLHLSFTDFELPIDVGTRGIRDTEAILLETVVSLHDRGHWVGDLDIISAFTSGSGISWEGPIVCPHSLEGRSYQHIEDSERLEGLISIDSWDELLDMPAGNIIVRAHGNWLARLAAATISIQKRRRTVFLPPITCWQCLGRWNSIGNVEGFSLVG